MSIFSKQSKYFLCEEAAAGHQFDLVPGEVIEAPDIAIIRAYVGSGVLKPLAERPGDWVKVRQVTEKQLTAVPPPDPVSEKPITAEEIIARMREEKGVEWTPDDLTLARARYGFPPYQATRQKAWSEKDPDPVAQPLWYWNRVEQWLNETGKVAAALAGGRK